MENEALIQENDLIEMNNVYNICKSTVQIKYQNNNSSLTASGFFIKFQKSNQPFFCLMTNDHCINNSMMINKEEILILYENKKKELKIKLNQEERLMKSFKNYEDFSLDITIIQIIEKDQISEDYFLLPNLDYIDKYDFLIGEGITIPQFPFGGELQMSKGEIKVINYNDKKYEFCHTASTLMGSSGSPIILQGKESVLGLHKAGNTTLEINYGDFIGPIIKIINTLQRNGKGIEYYKNGEKKYEGNFKDDEYDGDNEYFYYENGDVYFGQFKNGKKNGHGFICDKCNNLKVEGEFLDDKLIEEAKSDSDNDEENNINNNEIYDNEEGNEEKENQDSNNNNNNSKDEENKEYLNNVTDSNNNENNYNKNFYTIKTHMFHIFQPLGNALGMICNKCSHLISKHKTIGFGKWKCEECEEGDNICESRKDGI